MTATFMNAFCEPFAHAQKKPWVVPTPSLVECIAYCSTSLCSNLGKCGGWEEIRSCTHQPRLSQGWSISWIWTWEAGQGVWHSQLANSSLPYCRYAGICLLEEKIVSNILRDWQGMCVKAFIHIALACK